MYIFYLYAVDYWKQERNVTAYYFIFQHLNMNTFITNDYYDDDDITVHVILRNILSRFCSNSEASSSESWRNVSALNILVSGPWKDNYRIFVIKIPLFIRISKNVSFLSIVSYRIILYLYHGINSHWSTQYL